MTTPQMTAAGVWSDDEPPSLNLTPQRGPSVWHQIDRKPPLCAAQLAAIAGGMLLVASSIRQRSSRDTWIAAMGMGAIAAALFCRGPVSSLGLRLKHHRLRYDAVDHASEDSFPASDPPSSGHVA